MATTAQNNIVKELQKKWVIPDIKQFLSSTQNINQGDLCYLDTTNHLVKPVASDANAANLLGVSPITVVNGQIQQPYSTATAASQSEPSFNGPVYGVVASLIAHTGDAINPGDKVYVGADAQHVTTATGNSNAVGIYIDGAAITSASAGQKIHVLVGAQYPAGALNL